MYTMQKPVRSTFPIPSLLVDAGVLPLDLRRKSLLVKCWYRVQRLPESASCMAVSRDFRSPHYLTRPSFPKPFGFRVASVMEDLSIPSLTICPHRFPKVGYWQFPPVSVCGPAITNKNSLQRNTKEYKGRTNSSRPIGPYEAVCLIYSKRNRTVKVKAPPHPPLPPAEVGRT